MALLLLVGLSAAPPTTTTTTEVSPAERGLVLASCALSGLGSGLLVATHARWPELRTRPRQLLLYLSLADLLSAASYFYGALRDFPASSWDCVAQGALSTFANTSSFFWTMAIALDLYLTIVRGAPGSTGLLAAFHVVSVTKKQSPDLLPAVECVACIDPRGKYCHFCVLRPKTTTRQESKAT